MTHMAMRKKFARAVAEVNGGRLVVKTIEFASANMSVQVAEGA